MSDINRRLKDVDPLVYEAGLPAEALRAMRQTVMAAAWEASWRRHTWGPLAVAAAAALTCAAVVAVERYWPGSDDGGRAADPSPSAQATQRQLQFATPGGTRVIWVFDSRFQP